MSHADNPDCIDCREPRAMMPRTTAGRTLLAELAGRAIDFGTVLDHAAWAEAIDAIEREAAQQERERIREEFRKAGMLILDRRIDAILAEPSECPHPQDRRGWRLVPPDDHVPICTRCGAILAEPSE